MSIFSSVEAAIEETKQGRPLIIVDHPSRENQGDLFFAAETIDASGVNFMIQHGRGLVCMTITQDYAARLDLPTMVRSGLNTEATQVNFTISVDAHDVTEFGISARDRARTIKTILDKRSRPADLARPGHLFPLIARPGGILERTGHTEASSELAELAGFAPCGVICEILDDQGNPTEGAALEAFARKHDLKIVAISDLVAYRRKHTRAAGDMRPGVHQVATSLLPTTFGDFQLSIYRSTDDREHSLLSMDNDPGSDEPMLTRVHSQCLTGDTFGSLRCDCQAQLHKSLELIQAKGRGMLIYLDQEGRGIGLGNKIKAYELQDKGYDTVEANEALGFPADARSYEAAADILKARGVTDIDLLTNNPDKQRQLIGLGITVHARVPLEIASHETNASYLKTKKQKFGHHLHEA